MSKTTVIHHSADFDGIFCREIARKRLGKSAEYIGWNHGDPLIPLPDGPFYVMDLPPTCVESVERGLLAGVDFPMTWIDHHKTPIDRWPIWIPGYRIDGVAACRLAWQWFFVSDGARKQDFIDRDVSEPTAVRLAGEYDVWDKRDDNAELLQFGLRNCEPCWENLLDENICVSQPEALQLCSQGWPLRRYARQTDEDLVRNKSFRVKWEGLDFICLNTGRFNSLTFAALDIPETGHDALMGFMFNGKKWTVSMYHAKHRTDLDLSAIAARHGGGGHRGACGFTCQVLPFIGN